MLVMLALVSMLLVDPPFGRIVLDYQARFEAGTYGSGDVRCASLPPGRIQIRAWSPPGRSGEDAFFTMDTSDAQDDVYMNAVLTMDGFVSVHRVVGGYYCAVVNTTNRVDHGRGDPAAGINKTVYVRISHKPD